MDAFRNDPIVHGVVFVDGQRYDLAVRSEYLVADATAWFDCRRTANLKEAIRAEEDGDHGSACEMREAASEIEALLRAGGPIHAPGMWPNLRNRANMMPWTVGDDPDERRAYARRVVEFGISSDGECPVYVLDDDRGEIHVTSRLRSQARHSGPYRARVVEPAEIVSRIQERA